MLDSRGCPVRYARRRSDRGGSACHMSGVEPRAACFNCTRPIVCSVGVSIVTHGLSHTGRGTAARRVALRHGANLPTAASRALLMAARYARPLSRPHYEIIVLHIASSWGWIACCQRLRRVPREPEPDPRALDAVTPHLCFAVPRIWRQHRDGHSDHEPKQGIRVIRVWRAVAQHFLYSCPSRAKAVLILTAAAIYTLCVAHEHYIAQVRALYRQLGTRHLPARGGTAQGRAS